MKKRIYVGAMCLLSVLSLGACFGSWKKSGETDLFPSVGSAQGDLSTEDLMTSDMSEIASEAQGTLSDEEFKESLAAMAETLGEGYSIAAVENESGEVEYKFVPTQFPVYSDGKSHYLMYGANSVIYMYAPFTNISYPEYRIAEISLPSQMINPENGRKELGKEDLLASVDMEKDALYDTSARYSTTDVSVFSIEASSFIFRTWSVPFTGDPDTLDIDSMHSFYTRPDKMYDLNLDMLEESRLEEGSVQYSTMCFLKDYLDDTSQNSFARYTVVINNGVAYCYLAGGYEPSNAFWLDEYVLKHSFKFEER